MRTLRKYISRLTTHPINLVTKHGAINETLLFDSGNHVIMSKVTIALFDETAHVSYFEYNTLKGNYMSVRPEELSMAYHHRDDLIICWRCHGNVAAVVRNGILFTIPHKKVNIALA